MIPHDDFTPHGYLDNPFHSWKLNPSGVLRSLEPLGMGWQVPNVGTYVRNQFQYTAHLTIGLKINDLVLVTAKDFSRHGCTITSSLHTKNRFEYTCFIQRYGLTSEGDVFVHGVRAADDTRLACGELGYTVSLAEISQWGRGRAVVQPHITQSQEDTGWQVRTLALPCALTLESHQEHILNAVLARGVSQDQAYQHWEDGIEEIALAEVEHRRDDEEFWQRAPQLSGDWPDSWRRSWVYDLETLRMVIRPSAGIIPHPWDGMQLQAPREVLAEAAMDTLFLSYA